MNMDNTFLRFILFWLLLGVLLWLLANMQTEQPTPPDAAQQPKPKSNVINDNDIFNGRAS